jgi:type IV secretory pathway VirB10-like protein
MRRRVWIFLPSKKGAGCNAWQPFLRCWITTKVAYEGRKAICRPASDSENNLAQAIRQGASQSFNQTGEQVVGRSLNVQPTITIRPGFPVNVLVTHDLILEAYRA